MSPIPTQPEPGTPTLRVGFICARPLDEPNHLSGMPYHMAQALRAQGLEIVELCEHPRTSQKPSLPVRAIRRARWECKRRTPPPWQRRFDDAFPKLCLLRSLRQARSRTARIQQQLDDMATQSTQPDAIFVCCASALLLGLKTKAPIVYFSDATSQILRNTYTRYAGHGDAFFDAYHHVEKLTIPLTDAAVFASPAARDSAINDLGVPAERTRVVPMGANVMPDAPSTIHEPADPPTPNNCQLLIVAADPIRKRVDLALEATQHLRTRGINATLHVVGPGTDSSNTSPAAKPHGRLKLAEPHDRAIHQRLLRECHIQLLPSLGEAFGIAPIESAHFARPSIVSGVGGLPFVVQHDRTGIVIGRDADAPAWANAIESLIEDPHRYRTMSTAALDRARAELNWDAWGRSVAGIIQEAIAHRARD